MADILAKDAPVGTPIVPLTLAQQTKVNEALGNATGTAPLMPEAPVAMPAHSVDEADGTVHNLGGAEYVLDHANKKVFIKATEPDGVKLRATGGDYDSFVKKLPPVDQAIAAKKADDAAAAKATVDAAVSNKTAVDRAQVVADQAKADHETAQAALASAQQAKADADKALADAKTPPPPVMPGLTKEQADAKAAADEAKAKAKADAKASGS